MLSRVSMDDNWQLRPDLFATINSVIPYCTIDRFATSANAMLPTFNSYYHEQNSAGIDAFAQTNWHKHVNFVHPPISVLGRTVQFLANDVPKHSKIVIIFPMWTTQPWYMQLCAMCTKMYVLPAKGTRCFHKIANFPCKPYVKNENWQFAVGYINLHPNPINGWENIPNV